MMIGFKLDNEYSTPAYPKKDCHRALKYDEKARRWENILDFKDIYGSPYFYNQLFEDAVGEMNQVLSEQQPCKVMLANLSLLFWALKGPCYNYGGFKNRSDASVDKVYMNQNYITDHAYNLADQLRGILEGYSENIIVSLQNAADAELFPRVEQVYDKLLLLLYDLITGATVFFVSGYEGSINLGKTAYTDSWGTTTFHEKKSYYDDRQLESKSGEEILGREKYQAYCQLRPRIAQEVKRLSPTYPAEQNTWLYFGIDCNEINPVIHEIYGIVTVDLKNDEKRRNMVIHNKIAGGIGEFYKDVYSMIPIVGGLYKKGLEKMGVGEYKVGSIDKEEKELRKNISLYR